MSVVPTGWGQLTETLAKLEIAPKKQARPLQPKNAYLTHLNKVSLAHLVRFLQPQEASAVKTTAFALSQNVPLKPRDYFGNKATGLMEVQKLFKGEKKVQVPTFCPITHAAIQSHLERNYKEYKSDWQKFVQSLDNGKLTPKSTALLVGIQDGIEKVFDLHPFSTKAMEEFLKTIKALLMVRSSGKEDTDKLANAGGNISVAGVVPIAALVSKAMGKVVASYHSPLSLTQRQLAKDDIKTDPFTPVLLQTMIGEAAENTNPPHIPVSGVVYTREVLGRTENLYQIQATLGHNEAVVMSRFPVDTYFAYPDGTHHTIIRKKEERLVADPKTGFVVKQNPKALAQSPALPPQKVAELQRIAQRIHEFYKDPRDIEWVYNRAEDTFYIVQARPIVNRAQLKPSYLDKDALERTTTAMTSFKGQAIVSKAEVTACLPTEVIHDTSLERAFQRYWRLVQTDEAAHIKAIVISQYAASTSHYACTLREMGVELFFAKDCSAKELQGRDTIILIAPQEEKLIITKTNLHRDAFVRAITKPGWFRHPIAAIASLQHTPFDKKLCDNLLKGHCYIIPMHLRETLRKLSDPDKAESNNAMKDLVAFASRMVGRTKANLEHSTRSRELFNNLAPIAMRFITTTSLERLHAAKRAEALLLQEDDGEILDTDSLLQIINERKLLGRIKLQGAKPTDTLTAEQRQKSAAIYSLVTKRALQPEFATKWQQFALQVAATGSAFLNRLLINMIRATQKLGILDNWLNLRVISCLEKNKSDMKATLRDLYHELDASKNVLSELLEAKKQLNNFKAQESAWADPAKYEMLCKTIEKPLFELQMKMANKYISKPPLPPLAKSAIMHFLKEALDVHDTTIKAMRSSPQYTDKELQADRFKQMLLPYSEIMKFWVHQVPDKCLEAWLREVTSRDGYRQKKIATFRQTVCRIIETALFDKARKMNANELRQSRDFNVSWWVINNCRIADKKPKLEGSLEDIFMLVHQNSLAALASVDEAAWSARLPHELRDLHTAIMTIHTSKVAGEMKSTYQANLLDVSYNFPTLTVRYNIPLRGHSAFIQVEYNTKTEQARLDLRLIGNNEEDRFQRLSYDLFIQCMAYKIDIYEMPTRTDEGLTLSCRFSKEALISSQMDLFQRLLVRTLVAILDMDYRIDFSHPPSPPIDQNNPSVWDALCHSKEAIRLWVGDYPEYHLYIMLKRFLNKGWHEQFCALFASLGLQIAPSNKANFLVNTFQAIVTSLPNNYFIAKPANYVQLEHANPTAQLFLDFLKESNSIEKEFVKILLQNKEKVLYRRDNSPKVALFVVILQKLILAHSAGVDATNYVDFLIAKEQWETLAEIYHFPVDNYSDLKSLTALRHTIANALKGKVLIGYELDATAKAHFKPVAHFKDLAVGATVCYKEKDKWIASKVLKVNPDFVEVSTRYSRGRVIDNEADLKFL